MRTVTMLKRNWRLTLVLAALLVSGAVAAELPQTDTDGLTALAERLRARHALWQGPEYQQLKAMRTGYWGALNADPERELMGVDEDGNPIIYYTDNSNAALSTRASTLYPGGIAGYELTGATSWGLAVWDNGVANPNHPEFTGRIIIGDNTSNYEAHANHTAGTLVAAGVSPNAKGMSYGAYLNSFEWSMDTIEMTENANWLHVSSHSYHSGGVYDSYTYQSEEFDEIAYLAPYYLICQAAANDGPGYHTIPSSNLGKNVLTVGAVNDVPNYTGPNSVSIANFSSRGPTEDGRLKPEIVGNGVYLYSTLASGYTSMSGTSMSTPNVAGTMFLLVELYQQTHAFQAPMSSTLKALAVHTADECGPNDGPDYIYGYGLLNAHAAADLIALDGISPDYIQQQVLPSGELFSFDFEADGTEPLRATLCWLDPPAEPGANPALVNDLDMRIVRLSDGEDWEPYVLNPDSPSQAAFAGDNDLDNLELVHVADPEPGMYRVQIAVDGQMQGDEQSFSLVITGMVDNTEPVELTLDPSNTDLGNNGGMLSYTATLVNNTDTPYSGLQMWTMAQLPNGSEYGPLFTSNPFNLSGGQSLTSPTLRQMVPAGAPSGTYTFIANVGEYPDILTTSSFEFSKGLTSSIGEPVLDWSAEGDLTAEAASMPDGFILAQAWPNPFNAETRIQVTLASISELNLRVYDVQGRLVKVLADDRYQPGRHEFTLTSDNLASGVYFVRAEVAGRGRATQKVMHVQ